MIKNSHNPYFNRWFSAINSGLRYDWNVLCHNPYFNRWFSAIPLIGTKVIDDIFVTILILIDGFLQ